MRTNVVLDDELVAEAMRLTGIKTKRELIDTALQALVRLERQKDILALEGAVHWEGDLDEMRSSRFLAEEGESFDADTD
ncbi:MAG: type II toxin-antitoxin system VapB family antitoxin [Anaerolineae bacterium]